MDAQRELTEAYAEWRRLVEAAGEAIRVRDWDRVSACQTDLQNLQTRISRLTPAARTAWSLSDCDRAVQDRWLNTTVQDLIQLERRNLNLLAGMKENTCAKLNQLGQARRNLNQIQRSYGFKPRATWNSIS
jgi:hypothetical protein